MIYLDTTKESGETPTTVLQTPFWTSLDVTADSGEPTGFPACAYTMYTAPGMHHAMKLRYGVDNPGEVRPTA